MLFLILLLLIVVVVVPFRRILHVGSERGNTSGQPMSGVTHGIEVLHRPVLIRLVLLLVVLVVVDPLDPVPPPVDVIQLLVLPRPEPEPLHPWPTLRPLANLESIYFRLVDPPRSALLASMGIRVHEGRGTGR